MSHDPKSTAPGRAKPSGAARPATIVIADDEWIFRASLRQLLTAPPDAIKDVYGIDVGRGFSVVGEAGNGEEAVTMARSAAPDLLLLDLDMPRMSGIDCLRELQPLAGRMNALILAGDVRKSDLFNALHLGVRGLMLKDAATEVLFEAIVSVLVGRYWLDQALVAYLMELAGGLARANASATRRPFGLTPREQDVLKLVVAGYANKEIAQTYAVSEETVKHHLTRIFDKVGASNRLELALLATESGIVSGFDAVQPAIASAHAPGVLQPVITSG